MTLVLYDVQDQIAVVTLNRPTEGNAQDPQLLRELNEAFFQAGRDEDVRVIVLRAEGKNFSGGHDLKAFDGLTLADANPGEDIAFGGEDVGIGPGFRWEEDNFLGTAKRMRDIQKPTIASVQGACIAAGLQLIWPCDLIVASQDAYFSDPVALMGVAGVEYHGHTWEMGPRRAKEFLFTAEKISADEAYRLGMLNHVVPREELDEATMKLARRIARVDPFTLAQIKRVVNTTMDIQGQAASIQAAFDNHWLGHANALSVSGNRVAILAGLKTMKAGMATERSVDNRSK